MKGFYETLSYINRTVYSPIGLNIKNVHEEKQNAKYGAGSFETPFKTVRFRVASKTPKKVGQFVVIWRKDENNKNRSYTYDEAHDLLVVTVFNESSEFGQFIFPKEILVKQNIVSTNVREGKMGFRVYPEWDKPTSRQGIKTQEWQLPYFVYMNVSNQHDILRLFSYEFSGK
ncbi:MepB family protein [Geomicrobium sp. JCM 19039]|uniref:MepB family protein n=1 Tax=Geomicrobium sp. JCM 19039 TaxID=1460636 RepID=UPI00045F297C|nr:MepB family protein [Geomicrobium sp. JCM 19039]GAK12439.1 hypothetical protein JCM19039_2213 [Geomicrobium sp. JCM 19039]